MTGDKWMTSGANRLKSRMNRTFERRASLDRQTPSPRVSSSFEPSTTTRNHPSFIRRNTKGREYIIFDCQLYSFTTIADSLRCILVTGTYSRWADPIYRRGITPSSPRRGALHENNEYPPGTILPRKVGDIGSTAYQQMPVTVNPAPFHSCDPYQDQQDRSPHPHLQRQNVAFIEPHHHIAYGYDPSFESNPAYSIQRTGPLCDEVPHFRDSTYQEQNAAHYRDTQAGDQSQLRSRERSIRYAPLQPRHFDPYSQNHDHVEMAFTPQSYAVDNAHTHQHVNVPMSRHSERGFAQFRNPNRIKNFDRGMASPFSDFNKEALHFDRQVPCEHSFRQTITDGTTNRNTFDGYNDTIVNQTIISKISSEAAAYWKPPIGNFASNFERNGFAERLVSDQRKFHFESLRENEDFVVKVQDTEVPKGIDRFKRRPHKSESDPSLKRPLADESTERENKRHQVDLVDQNVQKENVSPSSECESRTIGAPTAVRFFDGNLEVNICGRPLHSKQHSSHSDPQQPPSLSPDPFGNMCWNNEGSLWG